MKILIATVTDKLLAADAVLKVKALGLMTGKTNNAFDRGPKGLKSAL